MTDTSDAALDAMVTELIDTSHGIRLSRVAADAITALRAENATLKAAKWDVQHTDTMNDMVQMGLSRDAALAERDAAYARGVHDAADWLKEQSLTEDELQQGITFKDNYPTYAAAAILSVLLPQAIEGDA